MFTLTARYDISHSHSAFTNEYNNGGMNGFDRVFSGCKARATCPAQAAASYGYVPQSETQPYFALAEQFAFGDEMFETNEGPSFPAHQYIVSGTSSTSTGSTDDADDNPTQTSGAAGGGGCDSPAGTTVSTIDMLTRRRRDSGVSML